MKSKASCPKGRGFPARWFFDIMPLDPALKGRACGAHSGQKGKSKVAPEDSLISALRNSNKTISSLALASELTRQASRLGFDWPDLSGVLKKLDEELKEFKEALSLQNRSRIREEFGDLLFALVNVSRFLRVDPEDALRRTVTKFMVRFHYIETSLRKKGKSFHQSNLNEMDRLWEEAKKKKK